MKTKLRKFFIIRKSGKERVEYPCWVNNAVPFNHKMLK